MAWNRAVTQKRGEIEVGIFFKEKLIEFSQNNKQYSDFNFENILYHVLQLSRIAWTM